MEFHHLSLSLAAVFNATPLELIMSMKLRISLVCAPSRETTNAATTVTTSLSERSQDRSARLKIHPKRANNAWESRVFARG